MPHHPNTAQKLSYRDLFTSYGRVKAKESGEARNEFFRHQPYCVVHCSSGQPISFILNQAYLTNWVPFVSWQDLNQYFWVCPKAFCDLTAGWPVHVTMAESRSWGPLYHTANTSVDQDHIQIVDEIAQQDTDCQLQCNPQKWMLLAQINKQAYKGGVLLNCTGISRVLLNKSLIEYSKQLFAAHSCKLTTQRATEAPIILLFNFPPRHVFNQKVS